MLMGEFHHHKQFVHRVVEKSERFRDNQPQAFDRADVFYALTLGMDFGLTNGLEITAEDELTAEEVNKWLLLNTDN